MAPGTEHVRGAYPVVKTLYTAIESLHDAERTYTRAILPRSLVSFCMARYGEKQQKTLELRMRITPGIKYFQIILNSDFVTFVQLKLKLLKKLPIGDF